jgi:hypothetical protein
LSASGQGPSKKFQPAGWMQRLVPVILILLLLVLVATILFVLLSVLGLVG